MIHAATSSLAKTIFILMLHLSVFGAICQEIVTEEYQFKNGNIELPGTLSFIATDKKLPLVIYVHGSGNIDRNGNQAGIAVKANYIKMLSDSLIKKGIAFYRFDKRTATSSNIAQLIKTKIKFLPLVRDVQIGVSNFKKDTRFSSIHLVGHSQGSLVAMLAVSDDISSFTSIAGPSASIDQTIITQLTTQNEDLAKVAISHFNELKKTDTIVNVNPFLMALFAPYNHSFILEWMSFKPTTAISKIKIPILILHGGSDLQVSLSDAKALKQANTAAEVQIIPRMNHILKEVNSLSENQASYADPKMPISALLVTYLADFILENKN